MSWTSGPWNIVGRRGGMVTNGNGGAFQGSTEDAELVALAPEMAEAILAMADDDVDDCEWDANWTDAVRPLAERLRAIKERQS